MVLLLARSGLGDELPVTPFTVELVPKGYPDPDAPLRGCSARVLSVPVQPLSASRLHVLSLTGAPGRDVNVS
jgi:hypothetical protein